MFGCHFGGCSCLIGVALVLIGYCLLRLFDEVGVWLRSLMIGIKICVTDSFLQKGVISVGCIVRKLLRLRQSR